MDFISTCTCPRGFFHHVKEAMYWCDWSPREGVDDITAVLTGFQLCQVRDETGYINGFTEELIANRTLEE